MGKIKIVIADDQRLICEGIRIILESQPDIEVTAIAENGEKAVECVAALCPDIILMDIQMPVLSGLEALKVIKERYPDTTVLMLTTFDPDEYILEAFKSGADGYLLKDLSGDRLAAAIRDAHAGNVTIPASIAARIIAQIPGPACSKTLEDYNLTQRENEIAQLVAKGFPNEKIAEVLGISLGTVKNYVSTLYSKLGAGNRREAVCMITGLSRNGRNKPEE